MKQEKYQGPKRKHLLFMRTKCEFYFAHYRFIGSKIFHYYLNIHQSPQPHEQINLDSKTISLISYNYTHHTLVERTLWITGSHDQAKELKFNKTKVEEKGLVNSRVAKSLLFLTKCSTSSRGT